jgi:hypothetical protein
MSRDCGFEVGDRSTRTLYDTRLLRAYKVAGLQVVVAWDAIVDESWAKGERVTIEDALLPLPYVVDVQAVTDALRAVELLDAEGRIRDASWSAWFETANARRATKREHDRAYAKRMATARWGTATESVPSRPRVANGSDASSRPSVPTVRPPRAPARGRTLQGKNGKTGPVPLADLLPEAYAAIGFHPVPKPGKKS